MKTKLIKVIGLIVFIAIIAAITYRLICSPVVQIILEGAGYIAVSGASAIIILVILSDILNEYENQTNKE